MPNRSIVLAALVLPPSALAFQSGPGKAGMGPLFDDADATATSADMTMVMGQLNFMATAKPGAQAYPGVRFTPKSKPWDLRKYGHMEATVRNSGPNPLVVTLRVENAGSARDRRWNAESVTLGPGEEKSMKTIFGYGDGMKKGYRLDPSKVVGVSFLASRPAGAPKIDGQLGFIVERFRADGAKGEKPGDKAPRFGG